MNEYEKLRQKYRPSTIKTLIITESPPPPAQTESSRHFYRSDKIRQDDRLFINTIRALFPETMEIAQVDLERDKKQWLRKFQENGWFMIEALEHSLPHEITKQQRQALIVKQLPVLVERIKELANSRTKIILVKSNVFEVAAEPLRNAGFTVLNKELLDYPGRYNQRAFREKLSKLATKM